MNNDTQFEKISALADSALDQNEMDALLKQLYSDSGRQAWDTYHRIGDALRSDDLASPLSQDFEARFAARFASEPVLIAPARATSDKSGHGANWRKWMPLYSLGTGAAAALLAVLILPQMHKSTSVEPALQAWNRPAQMAGNSGLRLASVNGDDSTAASNPALSEHTDTVAEKTKQAESQVEVLRNPDLDSYLIAHQRFSPALGASAQYLNRANLPVNNPEK